MARIAKRLVAKILGKLILKRKFSHKVHIVISYCFNYLQMNPGNSNITLLDEH